MYFYFRKKHEKILINMKKQEKEGNERKLQKK
jgi:hypothetical protein